MIIAYILEVNPYENSGIIKKVNDQIYYWKKKEHQVFLFLPWPDPSSKSSLYIDGETLSSKWVGFLPDGFFKNYFNKMLSARKLFKQLKAIKPDIVYIRQNTWYPGITKIFKNNTTILELNTVDIIEIKYYTFLKKMVYLYGREKILNSAKGLVAVSPDILKHYSNYKHLRTKVVSNGINLDRIKKVKTKGNDTKRMSLVFVGIRSTEWHGLDKIILLAKKFPDYFFNIVGSERKDFPNVPDNMKFHGWVEKDELENIYKQNHFGIGSFGNHLVGKVTDSTLKVREYLAYGLPVVLGHNDVDFDNASFLLKATDTDHELIELGKIKQFLEKNKNTVVGNEELTIIDSQTKEDERLSFFKEMSVSLFKNI